MHVSRIDGQRGGDNSLQLRRYRSQATERDLDGVGLAYTESWNKESGPSWGVRV